MPSRYAWSPEGNPDNVQGPFASLDDAIADAEALDPGTAYFVGPIKSVIPENWSCVLDAGQLIERMEELITEEVSFDDAVFSIPMRHIEEADKELAEFLAYWARAYVKSDQWYFSQADGERRVAPESGGPSS
jgi:hypothetical protein